MLPVAPDTREKNLYLDPKRATLYGLGIFSTCVLFIGNILFISANPGTLPYAIFTALLMFYLAISYFIGVFGKDFDTSKHLSLHLKWLDKSEDASIDVYLPICGEPMDILHNTWTHVKNLRYYYPNMRVYVLNDRHTPEMEEFVTRKFGFGYIKRPTNELKKAGNLRNAFTKTNGEFIAIFDADFCPRKDFFLETLPYMFEDPRIGIVQTPQFFAISAEQNWLERGAAMIQELFYRVIQVNRNTYNGSICVGTNALYRRSALAPFGGTAPIEYSEDVHTGFQIISLGGKIQYVPLNLAAGVCPSHLSQYFPQQSRWAMGSVSLFFSKKFWKTRLTFAQRICYLSGMFYYMTTGLFVIVGPFPSLYLLIKHPEKIFWFNLLASVPSLLYGTVYLYMWSSLGKEESFKTRCQAVINSLSARHTAYFAHLFALVEYLVSNNRQWTPTNLRQSTPKFKLFCWLFSAHFFVAIVLPLFISVFRVHQGLDSTNFLLLWFFLTFNLVVCFFPMKDIWLKN